MVLEIKDLIKNYYHKEKKIEVLKSLSYNFEKGKFYGVDNDNNLVLAFRAYVDQTGVGPSYYEIIYDRTIVFHKK